MVSLLLQGSPLRLHFTWLYWMESVPHPERVTALAVNERFLISSLWFEVS